jgi:hypothetical protein
MFVDELVCLFSCAHPQKVVDKYTLKPFTVVALANAKVIDQAAQMSHDAATGVSLIVRRCVDAHPYSRAKDASVREKASVASRRRRSARSLR